MKRKGNLYDSLISIDNLILADTLARKGKSCQIGVKLFDRNREQNIADIYRELVTKTYKTSEYKTRVIQERKERLISILPYRDRVVQHAIMNVLEPVFVSHFTGDTYSCIKGRGIHKAVYSVKKALRDEQATRYCLKMDVTKFYPSVDNGILKQLLRRLIKDKEVLWLLDGIIDSATGLPIGNYLSQYLANYYLSAFDHWIKEVMRVSCYYRYADDIVIFSNDKRHLHWLRVQIQEYLADNLKLQINKKYRMFPVSEGVDFLGYVFFHTHTLIRKSIKQSFAMKVAKGIKKASLDSYKGWTKHANCKHLLKKLLHNEEL